MLSLLLLLQAADAQWLEPLAAIQFDLRRVQPAPDAAGDVVVTARRLPPPRIIVLPDLDEPYLPRAQMPFGGGKMSLDVDQRMLGSAVSNRVMLTWKLAF